MIFRLNDNDKKELEKLASTLDENIGASDIFNFILDKEPNFTSKEEITEEMNEKGISEEEAYLSLLLKEEDINPNDTDMRKFLKASHVNDIKALDEKKYLDDPYYKNIRPLKKNSGKWRIDYNYFAPYEAFIYEDVKVNPDDYYREYTSLGYFKTKFPYLIILNNNRVYMSITPHEINTMKACIKEAKGKVVVFGLGLGYYPYMIAQKEEVTDITVIENDKNVIDLFYHEIFPFFGNSRKKIHLIEGDAFNYAKREMGKQDFDYGFVDLWHDEEDGLEMYLKMQKINRSLKKPIQLSYWIEESILTILRRIYIDMILTESDGGGDGDFLKSRSYFDLLENHLHFLLKDKVIYSYNDIKELLTPETMVLNALTANEK